MKTIAALLLAMLFISPIALQAQQLTANTQGGTLPNGISVIATGKVNVRSWLQISHFTVRSAEAASTFEHSLEAAGIAQQDVGTIPVPATILTLTGGYMVTVTAPPTMNLRLNGIARNQGIRPEGLEAIPQDSETLYRQALALAVQNARKYADAIASADHQHAGRLLNFVPSPVDMARMAPPIGPINGVPFDFNSVSASGIATFELIP